MIDKNIIEKTEEVKPYPIKGEYKNLPIYRIPLNQLKYNKMNGRISTYITEYEKEYGKLPEDTEELNQLIEGFIENTNPGELKKQKLE